MPHEKPIAAACIAAAVQAHAADKNLLDQARTEGRVAFYANITAVEPIMKVFMSDTGVKAEYLATFVGSRFKIREEADRKAAPTLAAAGAAQAA